MIHEVYTDLENEYFKEKYETIRMEFIKKLVQEHPNDSDLGKEIRKFINEEKYARNK